MDYIRKGLVILKNQQKKIKTTLVKTGYLLKMQLKFHHRVIENFYSSEKVDY